MAGGADPAQGSSRAIDRGLHQVGSLGSGNHFLEVQVVDKIFDPAAAGRFGLAEGQVCVMIHCGSRGLGHQICRDHVQVMDKAMGRYGITVPDRQLACAPASSPGGPRLPGRDGRRRELRAGEPVPLENRIQLVTCRSSARQAACVYSLIRPPRTGFRRICRLSTSVTVARGASGSSSGTRWAMPWCGAARIID